MNKFIDSPKAIAPQGISVNETAMVGKIVGKSKRKHFVSKITCWFTLILTTPGIIGLVAIDTKLLAGTMGETIWNQFGDSGMAVFVPLALVMIAAFAHRLISTQSDDDLKKSWLGRLVKKLSVALLFSVAVLFSVTMLKSLYPAAPSESGTATEWGQSVDVAPGLFESKASEFAAFISPFAEGIFALVSGGVLLITAFLLMIMMDWWYNALKTLIVGHSLHNTLLDAYDHLKGLRARYIPVAATINTEAAKTQTDRETEFVLYLVSQGLKAMATKRAALSDRKLKDRIKNPSWQEIGEETQDDDPAAILKQRKEFTQSLNIETILIILRGTYI